MTFCRNASQVTLFIDQQDTYPIALSAVDEELLVLIEHYRLIWFTAVASGCDLKQLHAVVGKFQLLFSVHMLGFRVQNFVLQDWKMIRIWG